MVSNAFAMRAAIAELRAPQSKLFEFISENSFCTLITCGKNELFTSHINLIQHRENFFFGHLAAANPQAKQLENGSKVLAIFKKNASQPDEISTVHLQGTVEIIHAEEEMASMLSGLVSKYESGRKPEWSINWDEKRFRSQMKGIVGFNITPSLIEEAVIHRTSEDALPPLNIALSVDINKRSISTTVPIYTPRYFSEQSSEVLSDFMRTNPSCTMVIYSETGLLHAYHLDSTSAEKKEDVLSIAAKLALPEEATFLKKGDKINALLIFNGPHTYISPTWYKTPHSVPTWNYVVVHAHGFIHVLNQEEQESGQLLDLQFEVTKIDGKFKLNQNRTIEDKKGVIEGLSASDSAADHEVAELMNTFSLG